MSLKNDQLDDEPAYERVESFAGGVDAFRRSTLIDADQSQLLENVIVRDNYEARTRPGIRSLGIPPLMPTVLTAETVSDTEIDLAWTNNAPDATAVNLYRSTVSSGPYALVVVLEPDVTSYSDSELVAATQYFYIVKAAIGNVESNPSNEAAATTDGFPLVTNLMAVYDADNAEVDSWRNETAPTDPDTALSPTGGDLVINANDPLIGNHKSVTIIDQFSVLLADLYGGAYSTSQLSVFLVVKLESNDRTLMQISSPDSAMFGSRTRNLASVINIAQTSQTSGSFNPGTTSAYFPLGTALAPLGLMMSFGDADAPDASSIPADDGAGNILPFGIVTGGTVDYVTGDINVTYLDPDPDAISVSFRGFPSAITFKENVVQLATYGSPPVPNIFDTNAVQLAPQWGLIVLNNQPIYAERYQFVTVGVPELDYSNFYFNAYIPFDTLTDEGLKFAGKLAYAMVYKNQLLDPNDPSFTDVSAIYNYLQDRFNGGNPFPVGVV